MLAWYRCHPESCVKVESDIAQRNFRLYILITMARFKERQSGLTLFASESYLTIELIANSKGRKRANAMDSTIIASIIGGVCAIGAALVTFFLTRKPNNENPYINPNRQRKLKGQWEGFAHSDAIPQLPSLDYRMFARITATTRDIQAEADMQFQHQGQTINDHLEVNGKLAYDRFLKLEYEVKDKPEAIQFGFLILELSSDGQKLYGRYLSYGARLQQLVHGIVELHKIK
jgi:hypothetical protein